MCVCACVSEKERARERPSGAGGAEKLSRAGLLEEEAWFRVHRVGIMD